MNKHVPWPSFVDSRHCLVSGDQSYYIQNLSYILEEVQCKFQLFRTSSIGMSPSHPTKSGHFLTGHKDNNVAKIWGVLMHSKGILESTNRIRHQAVPTSNT